MAKIDVSVLDNLLKSFDATGPEQEKTAEEESVSVKSELTNAIKLATAPKALTKTAAEQHNPVNDLEKIAENVAARDYEELKKEAEIFGRVMADSYVSRLSEYNGVLDGQDNTKTAAEVAAECEAAGELDGYELGKWAMEQLAEVFTGQAAPASTAIGGGIATWWGLLEA